MAGIAEQAGSSLKRRSPDEVRVVRASDANTFGREREMNNTTVIDLRQFVAERNGEARTDSMKVAEAFGKQHKDVLRKLDSIECSADFRERNFTLTQETIMAGAVQRKSPLCEMTKDGFIFLVMGFTGKKAAQVKEAYISAFNWMAGQLGISQAPSGSIGAQGAKLIAAVKRCKVARLPSQHRRKALANMGQHLNSAFGVRSVADIPADKLDAARNFIAAYVVEGEWLEKDSSGGVTLTDSQAINLSHLLHSVAWVGYRWNQGIGAGLQHINRHMWAGTFEHVDNMLRWGRLLDRDVLASLKEAELRVSPGGLGGLRPNDCIAQGLAA
ncbi:Rha family transcriptional regulator [Pelagibacterium sp.]|uniref:Rha family transcriptional regulator n=1 Tax=Pelagibacterium sp. TaxID=1967288 RepID=UPI003A913EBA